MMTKRDFGPLAVMVRRHGYRKSLRALTYLAAVAIYINETGDRRVRVEDYSRWWGQTDRSTYRERAAWATVTGGAEVVDVAVQVVEQYQSSRLGRDSVQALSLDVAPFVPVA